MVTRLTHRGIADLRNLSIVAATGTHGTTGVAATLKATHSLFIQDRIPYTVSGQAAQLIAPPSPAPSGAVSGFFDFPSLADEEDFYDLVDAALGKVAWTYSTNMSSAQREFVFATNPGVLGSLWQDIHNDDEWDAMQIWVWQKNRYAGTTWATLTSNWQTSYLNYFKNGVYRADLSHPTEGDFDSNSANPMCHTCGWGLVLYGVLNNDSAAIDEAGNIVNIAISEYYNGTSAAFYPPASGANLGYGGGRQNAKIGILLAHLVAAGRTTHSGVNLIGWLNALIDAALGAASYTTVSTGDGTAGYYHSDQAWTQTNNMFTGWINGSQVSYASGDAAWAAGVRSNSSYQSAHHVYFLWLAYRLTGRADVRNRLIECARFYKFYAHDSGQSGQGGPFIGSKFGLRLPSDKWHVSNPGAAQYDLIAVNPLVWGYKLTGDQTLLAQAMTHMRKGTRWLDETPPGSPVAGETEVMSFLDTEREHRGQSGDFHFAFNKGQLPYCYQILENGGQVPNRNSNVPANILNLAEGSGLTLSNTTMSGVFSSSNHASLWNSRVEVFAYSGGCYDTSRGKLLVTGEGHNNGPANGVYGFDLYGSQTWGVVKAHTVPPSTSSASGPTNETASNGDPAATHTYNNVTYDQHRDRLVHFGLGSAAGNAGGPFPRLRFLDLATNAWAALNSSLSHGQGGNGNVSWYDECAKRIWGRPGGTDGLLAYYDSVANTVSTVNDGIAKLNIHASLSGDPWARFMIAIGGGSGAGPVDDGIFTTQILVWNLATGSATKLSSISGFPSALKSNDGIALEFHPPSRTFVAWTGGSTLYRIIPPSNPFSASGWSFPTITLSGVPLANASNGYDRPWGRFRWAPYPHDKSRGVFVWVVAQSGPVSSNVGVWKPNF